MSFVSMRFVLPVLALGALASPAAAQAFRERHRCGTDQVSKVDPSLPVPAAAGGPRTIYLNRTGATYQVRGSTDSLAGNVSSDVLNASRTTVTIPPLGAGFNWTFIAQCVRDAYAPYDVLHHRDQADQRQLRRGGGRRQRHRARLRPERAVRHRRRPTTSAASPSAASRSRSPRPTAACRSQDRELCATIAHEIGHLLALEHETLAADEMSYVPVSQAWPKSFRMENSTCGTTPGQNRPCSCNNTQPALPSGNTNSHVRLVQFIGRRISETIPPTVALVDPTGGTVRRNFTIAATASDASGVVQVEFAVDGTIVGTDGSAENGQYTIDVTGLTEGSHTITATASDPSGNEGTATVTVDVTFDCGGCPGGQTCFEGECFVANGEPCSPEVACVGGECAQTAEGTSFCTQVCDLGGDSCPDDGACVDVSRGDGFGLCDFSDSGGCGCQTSSGGGAPFAAIGLGAIGLGLIVARRRRRA
jgi:MYXO-CTERM domain-containing protein